MQRTLEKIGIPRATFYRWYDLYRVGGPEALDDRHPKPDRVWNRIPDDVRERIIGLALDEPALSPRELAVRFTDAEGYFVSEASERNTGDGGCVTVGINSKATAFDLDQISGGRFDDCWDRQRALKMSICP